MMETATLLENGSVIDGGGTEPRANTAVLLEGDRITAVGDDASTRAKQLTDVERVDVAGRTVMPGLIDSHCHMTFGEPSSNDELFFHRREGYSALLAAFNVQKLLLAGVTGFMDPDCLFNLGVELRDAIEAGMVEGPRMTTGGNALLTAVGGTAGRLIPDEGSRGYAKVVKNRDEMILETRRQIKFGADWIKIHATGMIPRQKAAGEIQVWSLDEMRMVCDTAHDLGTPVVMHCRNGSSTRDAARAGADIILHATHMDDEAVEAVVKAGVPITPTLTFQANVADYGHQVGTTPALIDIFNREIEDSAVMLRRAYDAGVRLISGSESGFSITPYGHWHAREMEVFVKHLGLSPLEAITTATRNGDVALRLPDEVGIIKAGALADVIVVDGDPLSDIRVLGDRSRLKHVFSGGRSVDLSRPWPERTKYAGEAVGVWSAQPLTWNLVNTSADQGA